MAAAGRSIAAITGGDGMNSRSVRRSAKACVWLTGLPSERSLNIASNSGTRIFSSATSAARCSQRARARSSSSIAT